MITATETRGVLDQAVADAVAQFPPLTDDVKQSISHLLRPGAEK